jgi:hypothetical protein
MQMYMRQDEAGSFVFYILSCKISRTQTDHIIPGQGHVGTDGICVDGDELLIARASDLRCVV